MKFTTSLIIFAVFCVGCKQPLPKPPVTDEVKKIDDYLQGIMERQHIPGLTLAITRHDTVIYTGAFGFRNIDTREPMKASCNFHWASVSKTFVATAIMQLVEQGKIDLDEKLITYVPYFKHQGDAYKRITIRQVLNHTSGIGDVADYEWDRAQNDEGAPERYVRSLENDKLMFEPGTDWRYSNTAFEILGVVITRVSGIPFESYVKKNIFDPLEMNTSSFIYPDIPETLRVSGHLWAGKRIVSSVYPYNRIHAPSSTLNSNVVEMTHYAIANLHHGEYKNARILENSSYDLLWKNSVDLKDKPAVGMSWFLGEHNGLKTLAHSGSDTGFRSHLLLVPEKDISVMVVCNYELCRTDDIVYGVLDLLSGLKPTEAKQQIGFAFSEVMVREGIEKAKIFYRQTNEDSTQRKYYLWAEDEGALAYPGYLFLDHKMFDEAIEVFRFNQELNPESGYAYGHLGVAYARKGDKELARRNLRKALELVPGAEDFKAELNKSKQGAAQ